MLTLQASRHEIDQVLDIVLRNTEFKAIPGLIESNITVDSDNVFFKMKLPLITVTCTAKIGLINGEVNLDINQITGNIFGIARQQVEKQILERVKGFEDWILAYKDSTTGDIRFKLGNKLSNLSITGLHLLHDSVWARLELVV